MKRALAVVVLSLFGCWGLGLAQDSTPTVTAKKAVKKVVKEGDFKVGTKKWRDAVKYAQDLKNDEKYQEAVDAAPLNIQKAWYALDVLRQMMGGVLEDGHWNGYAFNSKTRQFLGDKDTCLQQIETVKGYCDAVTQSIYSKDVETIKSYLAEYTDWINKGLPRAKTDDSSDGESGTD